jgi:hypothetical protein
VNALKMLRAHHAEAEIDAAVWIDNQPALRTVAAFLAHHRTARALAAAAIGTALAPISAVATAITAARLVDHAHAIAGEDSVPCSPCVTAEADEFARDGEITFEDAVNAWDLKDGGLT